MCVGMCCHSKAPPGENSVCVCFEDSRVLACLYIMQFHDIVSMYVYVCFSCACVLIYYVVSWHCVDVCVCASVSVVCLKDSCLPVCSCANIYS